MFEEVSNWEEQFVDDPMKYLYEHTEDPTHVVRVRREKMFGEVRWAAERSRDGRVTWDEIDVFGGKEGLGPALRAAYDYCAEHN